MTTCEDGTREPPLTWTEPKVRKLAASEAETGAAPDVDGFETFS